MENKILKVGFNMMREVFEEYTLGDEFMLFDNLMEKINPDGNMDATHYDFPIKLDVTIIVVCTEGLCRVKAGVDEIAITRGRVGVFLSGQIFQLLEMTPDFKGMFLVNKNTDPTDNVIEAMSIHRALIRQQYLEFPESFLSEFVTIYNLIKAKIREEDNSYRAHIVRNYGEILFYNICNIYMRQENVRTRRERSRREEIFEAFIREVAQNYRTEHAMGFYADRLCLTPKYLSSVVAGASGKSAAEWIDDYLVLEAKALLKAGNRTIQQVGDELNFSNQSHFGRFFKRCTGMSPKEYRKM